MRGVKDSANNNGSIERCECVAVVGESLVAERRDGKAFLSVARHDERESELEDHKPGVHEPCRDGR